MRLASSLLGLALALTSFAWAADQTVAPLAVNSASPAGLQVTTAVADGTNINTIARFGPASGMANYNDTEQRLVVYGSGDNTNGRAALALQENGSSGVRSAFFAQNGINTSRIPTASGGLLGSLQVFADSAVPLQLGTNNVARMTIDSVGNVGIGSAPVGGLGQLQIQPGSGTVMVRLNGGKTTTGEGSAFVCGQGGGYNQAFGNWSSVIGGAFDNMGVLFSATGWKFTTGGTTVRMFINSAGNIGMGTTSPSNVLHVVSPTNLGGRFDIATANSATGAANLVLGNANTTVGNATGIEFANAGGGYSAFISAINTNHNANGSQSGGLDFSVFNAGAVVRAMTIAPNGFIGIGNTAPTNALTVAGIISAKEIKVTTSGADYVFDAGYALRPLAEVEAFVTRERHLPGMMAAKEMGDSGLPVSQVVTVQLAKIEELTLYAIQQQKLIDGLMAQQKAAAEVSARQDAALAQVLAKLAAFEVERGGKSKTSP